MNIYCKKYGYKFSINICCGKEIKYNYEWHRWMFYQFGFHIDVENVYDRIKVPVIHFSITKVNFVYLLVIMKELNVMKMR